MIVACRGVGRGGGEDSYHDLDSEGDFDNEVIMKLGR